RLRVDQTLVLFHRADILLHDENLILGLLPRDRILLGQRLIALLIHLRLRKQSLIARQLAFVLLLQIFVWPGIDLREKITLLDQLAFGESNFGQLAVDLGLHGHSSERRHRAELIEDDAHIAERRRRGADRLQCALRETASRRGGGGAHPARCLVDRKSKKEQDNDAGSDSPPRTRRRLHPWP